MKKPKIGVLGWRGRLGSALCLGDDRFTPIECNITDIDSLHSVYSASYDIIINCAAMTGVDACEKDFQWAMRINALAVSNIKRVFKTAKLVQISTDYIFSGFFEQRGPYSEIDVPLPINAYGTSKYLGELFCDVDDERNETDVIIRTTVLYDWISDKGNFVSNCLVQLKGWENAVQLGVSNPFFEVPCDLFGSPTYVPHLKIQICELLEQDFCGIINLAGNTVLSRYEFAKKIAKEFGFSDKMIVPVNYVKKDGEADRPRFAGLDVNYSESLGITQYSVDDGLSAFSGY